MVKQRNYSVTSIIPLRFNFFAKTLLLSILLALVSVFLNPTILFAAEGYSEINNALFDNSHMGNIKEEGKLNYQYKKIDNKSKDIINDNVSVIVTNVTDKGNVDQAYEFFTGEKKIKFQNRTNQRGNGLFMMFLEKDVHELERQTEGSWRHFQRRIRWAMASTDTKREEIEINHNNKTIKAVKYTFQPYIKDKKTDRYGVYLNKYYSFTLSDEIPGSLYEIHTTVPKNNKWKEGDEVIVDERITFSEFVPSSGS